MQRAVISKPTVRRGEDNSFGLGLSEDNAIIQFFHTENDHVLRIGDQVSAVEDRPLVRERLATLLARDFADQETVQLHISRTTGGSKYRGDIFASLALRNASGEDLDEWDSELWELENENTTWGTFWTLPILPGVCKVWLGVHASKMFTEPIIGSLELHLDDMPAEKLTTRWYSLRAEDAPPASVRAHMRHTLSRARAYCISRRPCAVRCAGGH